MNIKGELKQISNSSSIIPNKYIKTANTILNKLNTTVSCRIRIDNINA